MKKHRKKKHILVADAEPIVRYGLTQLIKRQHDFVVCGVAKNAEEMVELIKTKDPHLVLVGLALNPQTVMELIKDLVRQFQDVQFLVFSWHDELLYAPRVLHAGAKGFISKQAEMEQLLAGIRQVVGGGIFICETVREILLHKFVGDNRKSPGSPIEILSDRELEVLNLIGRSYEVRQIAEVLNLSRKTIETHRAHINRKLFIQSPMQLAQFAMHWVQSRATG